MKTTTLILLLLLILIATSSSTYSQSEKIEELIKNSISDTENLQKEIVDNFLQDMMFNKYSLKDIMPVSSNDTRLIDSVWLHNANGRINSYSFKYDSNKNRISYIKKNGSNSSWIIILRETYSYNDQNLIILKLKEYFNGISWYKGERSKYVYDSDGNIVLRLVETWKDNAWKNISRFTSTYDLDGMQHVLAKEWFENEWVNTRKSAIKFDINGYPLYTLTEIWDGTTWVNDTRYTYNKYENQSSSTELEKWIEGSWVATLKYSFAYDSNGNILSHKNGTLSENGVWKSDGFVSAYDENNNRLSFLFESWEGEDLMSSTKVAFTYDANNNNIFYIFEEWIENNWVSIGRAKYTYNLTNRITEKFGEGWNGTNWIFDSREIYSYSSDGNNSSTLITYWDENDWISSHENIYTYDADNNIIVDLSKWLFNDNNTDEIYNRDAYSFDLYGNVIYHMSEFGNDGINWTNNERESFTFEFDGFRTFAKYESWGEGTWTPIEKVFFISDFSDDMHGHYSTVQIFTNTATNLSEHEIVLSDYSLSQNYPNPFNPSTMIKYNLPEQSSVKIEIFNMLGQSVGILINTEKDAGFYETTWKANGLPSGVYLISIRAEGITSKKNFVQVKKALLLK